MKFKPPRPATLYGIAVASWFVTGSLCAGAAPEESAALLTVEGKVEILVKPASTWKLALTNEALKIGDRVRTGLRSRATIRLTDQTVLRVNELTLLEIRPGASDANRAALDLKAGSTYFFNRGRPSETDFRTPVASGAIRGTEFHVSVAEPDGRTVVTLLDGEVEVSNEQGTLALAGIEQATVEPGQAPKKSPLINALNVIQWCLYYPAVLDPNETGLSDTEKSALADSLNAYRVGDLLEAVSRYPGTRQPASDAERTYLAAILLAVGQVDQAQSILGPLPPTAPFAQALRRQIATVQNENLPASRLPATATEWMAESYALQSRGDLRRALDAAQSAVQASPDFGFATARVAELEFGFGRADRALQALDQSLALAPRNAQALALEGYVHAARGNHTAAMDSFEHAIAVDCALGNAWLGRGLCRIRQGDKKGGVADLQVAVTLEPQRSALRSYLGKAYSHAHNNARAEKELTLARSLDPNDPTAWLYSALVRQEGNQLNDAVRDLEQSKALNDNRAIFRSSLLLDQDQAVRSANLASIYRDVGMPEVSAREASRAVNYDYANFSAHLFLANSYDALRDPKQINLRYETPWLSELLVANLLAPVGAMSLSQNISQQEYSRFFEGNRFGVSSSTEYFSSGDWVQRGSQFGTIGSSSYALDVDYRKDNGQRPNNELEYLTASGKFKQQLTPSDSVFVQVIGFHGEAGDVAQYYDQTEANPIQRVEETQAANVFVGFHHEWEPGSHTLILAGRLDDEFAFRGRTQIYNLTRDPVDEVTGGFGSLYGVDYESDFSAYTAELQQIWERGPHTIIAGGRYQNGRNETTATDPSVQHLETDLERGNAYGYYYLQVVEPFKIMLGVSYDHLDFPENNDLPPFSARQRTEEQVSPKAGFYYTPLKDTTLRGSYSQSLGGLYYDTSVRLEPSQLAGFNQAFRSIIPESVVGLVPGSEFENLGLAVDQKFQTGTYLSLSGELLSSSADRAVGAFDLQFPNPATPSTIDETLEFRERSLTLTVNQLLGQHWSVGASYRYADADLNEHFHGLTPALTADANRDVEASLHQVRLGGGFHHPCGFYASAGAVWSQQSNRGYSPDIPGDDFWHFDAYIGWRFLQRRLDARVGLLNIGDTNYRLNPLTLYSELPRERTFAARLQFYF